MACVKHVASFRATCTKDFLTEDSQRICRISSPFFLWSKHGYFSCLAQFFAKSLSEDFSKRNKNNVKINIAMKE